MRHVTFPATPQPATYMVTDPEQIGACIGVVTNALTGLQVAHYACGKSVPLNVDLCACCEEIVDGDECAQCGALDLATVVRLSDFSVIA